VDRRLSKHQRCVKSRGPAGNRGKKMTKYKGEVVTLIVHNNREVAESGTA